jgi:hypothetical protein
MIVWLLLDLPTLDRKLVELPHSELYPKHSRDERRRDGTPSPKGVTPNAILTGLLMPSQSEVYDFR